MEKNQSKRDRGKSITRSPCSTSRQRKRIFDARAYHWETEPDVARVANGIPNQLDRIRALGNAVVPNQAKLAFEILIGLKKEIHHE